MFKHLSRSLEELEQISGMLGRMIRGKQLSPGVLEKRELWPFWISGSDKGAQTPIKAVGARCGLHRI
jgi:hypothetical protein